MFARCNTAPECDKGHFYYLGKSASVAFGHLFLWMSHDTFPRSWAF